METQWCLAYSKEGTGHTYLTCCSGHSGHAHVCTLLTILPTLLHSYMPCRLLCCRQGHAFIWDQDSVQIDHQRGDVLFSGRWAANGERYKILMRPGSGGSSRGGNGIRRPPLQVGAQLLQADGTPADAAADAKGKSWLLWKQLACVGNCFGHILTRPG